MDKRKPLRRNAVEIEAAIVPKQEKRLRIVVLGAPRVGKTQLVTRFLGHSFRESYIPTIEDFHRLKYIIADHTYQLDVLDTSGQTLNPVMQNLTLLTGDLFLVLYSVDDRGSWNRAKVIVAEIEQVTNDAIRTTECIARNFKTSLLSDGGNIQPDNFENGIVERSQSSMYTSPITIFLVGNKFDLPDQEVGLNEVERWLNQREYVGPTKVDHVRISAKTNYMIQSLFDDAFTKSNLPIELGPNRHRKVTGNEYSSSVSLLGDAHKYHIKLDDIFEIMHSHNPMHDKHITKGVCHLSKEQKKSSTSPIALVCHGQRRPSIDTEVLLAISKVRTVATEPNVTTHDVVKMSATGSSSKVKKQLCKLTGLVLH